MIQTTTMGYVTASSVGRTAAEDDNTGATTGRLRGGTQLHRNMRIAAMLQPVFRSTLSSRGMHGLSASKRATFSDARAATLLTRAAATNN
jgi:hypothetical protein